MNGSRGTSLSFHSLTDWLPTDPPRVAPSLMTAQEAVVYLRLDEGGRDMADALKSLEYLVQTGRVRPCRVGRNNRFARDLAALPEGVEVVVLPPGRRPELKYDDFSRSADLIRQGYTNSAEFLETRAEEIRAEPTGLRERLARLRLPSGLARSRVAEKAAADPEGAIVFGDDEESPTG